VLCINDPTTTNVVLTMLRPFKTYFVYIRPKCDSGYGLCSQQIISFTTAGTGMCVVKIVLHIL